MKTQIETKTETKLMPGDSIEHFRKLLGASADAIMQAAAMLHRLVAADPTIPERLTQGPDAIPEGLINSLLRVAEKSLHPALILNRCPAYQKLSLLAYSTQESVINRGSVEVVIDAETGDTLKIPLVKLEGARLTQVISRSGVRSKDEQRAWLKRSATDKSNSTAHVTGPAYQIKRDKVIFLHPCELSKVELLRILEQMVA